MSILPLREQAGHSFLYTQPTTARLCNNNQKLKTMENQEFNTASKYPIALDDETESYLIETSKWAKILSILGFISVGVLALLGIVVLVTGSTLGEYAQSGINMAWLSVLYLALAAVYFFPIYYLYKFSSETRQGINLGDQALFTVGLKNLKSHYKFLGVFTLVFLSIYALAVVLGLLYFATYF